jgi:serine/threonine-protein kinase
MSPPNSDPLIGRLVAGRYRVIKPLGEGGMGQVYLAEHEAIEKKVALKVLRPEYSRKEDIVTRFQQEAISASRIKHPNVLDVFDFGKVESGEAFLAMEFLEGHDLSDELAKVTIMTPTRGLQIALQICRALGAAHARGVVHRDMKPDNVFLQRTADEEVVKIVDFGIAQLRTNEEAAKSQPARKRLTKTGMIFGTPEYMAPEQAGGRHADLRVDVYAVGVILYEMFTGAVPFTGDSFMEVLTATITQPPPAMRAMNPELAIGPELEAVIMRALEKHPDGRHATMNEFAAAIVATPEGAAFARPSLGSIGDSRVSAYPPAGNPTAAQFGSGGSGPPLPLKPVPAVGATSAFGTPSGAAEGKTTPLAGHAASVAPQAAPSSGLIVGSLAFVAVALGVGGYFVIGHKASAESPAIVAEKHADVPTPEPSPPPPVVPSVAPAPSAVTAALVVPVTAPPSEIRLHVVTEPPGATVSKGGFQVCPATPCDLQVARNEGVALEAQKGALRGQMKILPQESQTVTIPLVAPAVKSKPAGPRMCEVVVEGLKILRPCAQ